jgi:hypothetical protein
MFLSLKATTFIFGPILENASKLLKMVLLGLF